MKKQLMLAVICALIISVFVALNYLLLEREHNIQYIQDMSASNNASVNTLGERIKTLTDANTQLQSKVSDLEKEVDFLGQENQQLKTDGKKSGAEIALKNAIIDNLKKQADLKLLEDKVRKWIDSIDKGQYDVAFALQNNLPIGENGPTNIIDFTGNYKEIIKSIQLKSIKLFTGEVPEEKKGQIVFEVDLDVKKGDGLSQNLFDNGANHRFFTVDYDENRDDWYVGNISNTP